METKTKLFIWNLWRIYTVQLWEELHITAQCFLGDELLKNEVLFKATGYCKRVYCKNN